MPNSTNFGMPFVDASQAQKEVTVNEFLAVLDAFNQGIVVSMALTAPPGAPADATLYIPASGATGAWSAWDLNVAMYLSGRWLKFVPRQGWRLYNLADATVYQFNGATWDAVSGTAVASVFGRTGAVVTAAGDYDASQVANDSGVAGATVAAGLDALNEQLFRHTVALSAASASFRF